MTSDGATSYDFACLIQRRRRLDLEQQWIRDQIAKEPGSQPTDWSVCIYDLRRPDLDSTSIVLRPPKDEAEAAQLKVAEAINEALPLVPRYPS